MGKRRKRVLPPTEEKPKRAREPRLYEGRIVNRLPPPNHRVSVDVLAEDERAMLGTVIGRYSRWPTLTLKTADRGFLFVAESHGSEFEADWAEHPPTWMDPQLFIELASQDPDVQRVLRVAFRKNDPAGWKHLIKHLQRVFDEQYLPYVCARFDEEAAPLLARWLLSAFANHEISKAD